MSFALTEEPRKELNEWEMKAQIVLENARKTPGKISREIREEAIALSKKGKELLKITDALLQKAMNELKESTYEYEDVQPYKETCIHACMIADLINIFHELEENWKEIDEETNSDEDENVSRHYSMSGWGEPPSEGV